MAASLQAAAMLLQPSKLDVSARRPNQQFYVSKVFGYKPAGAPRLTCSLQADLKDLRLSNAPTPRRSPASLSPRSTGAGAEGVPKRLTYEEIQSKTYMEVKGTGTANQCPTIEGGVDSFAFKLGKYSMKKFCLEPTSFTVKAEGVNKNSPP
ncbi:oxygen-evolving enhancer protein 1, chloroplastic-like protein [Cinnamomum micranthum f. kanehirae]|uniref:Oxygen-evolving enhancer protein 1, chloroplastic-like protein n=1 Tax=Cinnamomum micranthum f. kanehirae TaxID=337451 RepID=A0A3S3N7M2_9MAGN|nr:oxygen-evolving enhancer protein 1, chloroplastic-like protein [Cinnamomum micranthum f. kanehirae]